MEFIWGAKISPRSFSLHLDVLPRRRPEQYPPFSGRQDSVLEAPSMNGRSSFSRETGPHSTALIEAHIPGLRCFACALLRGDRDRADDLVQDTLERALSRWHQRHRDGELRGWIYTILYNRFLSDQHRQRRHAAYNVATASFQSNLPGIDGGQEGALIYRDLLRGFAELPDEQRSVLLLVGVEDFSYAEAARILGVPIGTVMSRLSRGRERLRQYMAGNRADSQSLLANDPASAELMAWGARGCPAR